MALNNKSKESLFVNSMGRYEKATSATGDGTHNGRQAYDKHD
jgi:hypothetical protein